MKKIVSFSIYMFFALSLKAQTINCNSFCVTNIYNDSVQTQVSVQMLDSGFVNYPHIAAILDQNGDTLSTGSMFYFGQVGETTQDYPTSLNTTDWSNFIGTIVFVYDNDTCSLQYPCNLLNIAENQRIPFNVFPNPGTDLIQLKNSHFPVNISFYSMFGQVVKRLTIASETQPISIIELPAGTYFVVPDNSSEKPILFIKH
jgi:hypothetical protein